MREQVLTVKQMQELTALGIDVSKASMLWYPQMAIDVRTGKGYVESHYLTINHIDNEHFWNTRIGKETYPTFILEDILNVLSQSDSIEFSLSSMGIVIENPNGCTVYEIYEESLLQNAYEALKWCKQNNHI